MRNMKKQIKIRNIRNVTLSAAFAACPIWSRTMSAQAGQIQEIKNIRNGK